MSLGIRAFDTVPAGAVLPRSAPLTYLWSGLLSWSHLASPDTSTDSESRQGNHASAQRAGEGAEGKEHCEGGAATWPRGREGMDRYG